MGAARIVWPSQRSVVAISVLGRPHIFMDSFPPITSVQACCCHNRRLQHRLGHHMQWALDRTLLALAHQLLGVVGCDICPEAVTSIISSEVCDGLLRTTLWWWHTSTTRAVSANLTSQLKSEETEVSEGHSHSRHPQLHNRRALSTEWRLHSNVIQQICRGSGGPVCLPGILPLCSVVFPDPGSHQHSYSSTQLSPGPSASTHFPKWDRNSNCCILLAQPDLVLRAHADGIGPFMANSPEKGPSDDFFFQKRSSLMCITAEYY